MHRQVPDFWIKRLLHGLGLLLIALCSSSTLLAQSAEFLQPPALPTNVQLQFAVLDVDGIDSSQQTFTANVFFHATWHDRRWVGKVDKPTNMPLDEVWNPNLQIINQQRLWITFPPLVTVYSDGRVVYLQRVWGDFSQPMNLRSFPLDKQLFEIRVTAVGYNQKEIEFVPAENDISGIADVLSLSDWEIFSHRVDFTPYRPYRGIEPGPSMAFQFEARRLVGYYIMKVLVPLLFIVGMSYLVFWIPIDQSSTRISVSITAMLTLIAYRFMIGGLLPKVSYMTRLDTFIMLSTTLVFATLILAAVTGALEKTRGEEARRMDFYARWIFPPAFFGVGIFSYTLW
jgi:hypothetical protein